jgi:hypothetical protein
MVIIVDFSSCRRMMISKRYSPRWLRLLLHPPIIHDEQVRLQVAFAGCGRLPSSKGTWMKGLIEDWFRNMYQRCWNDAIAYRQFVERRNVHLPVFAF